MTEYFQYTIGNNEIKSKNLWIYLSRNYFTDISFVIISALPNLIILSTTGILEETVTNNKDDFLMLIGNFLSQFSYH